jgi:hypothetical protein
MASQWPKGAIIAGIPLVLVGVAVLQRRMNGAPATHKMPAAASKVSAKLKRHKPKSRMRYYTIAMLINALERESTRRAVIGGLKLAQRRA